MEVQTPANGQANGNAYKSPLYGQDNRNTYKRSWLGGVAEKARDAVTDGGGVATIADRRLRKLNAIHIIFLLYSAAHNLINAWHRADHALFFLFVVAGILSVELMLWGIYTNWIKGKLIGKMLRVSKYAGILAMFYATAGILAQVQGFTGSAWLDFHYKWIMPTSAPTMFVFAFWIQAVDPVMKAERDAQAKQYFAGVEKRREVIDVQMADLEKRKRMRRLKIQIDSKRVRALEVESNKRRTIKTLERSAVSEMPRLLEEAGVSVGDANKQKLLLNFKYDPPKQIDESKPKNSAVNPRKMPGAHAKK
jgi:hypothetical protein